MEERNRRIETLNIEYDMSHIVGIFLVVLGFLLNVVLQLNGVLFE